MELSMLYFLVSGSAITDLYKNKIFNNWLLIGVIGAAVASIAGWSAEPLWSRLIRSILTILLLCPVYLAGGLGGGDVKLFAVTALFLSSNELLYVLILSFVIGAVIGLIKVVSKKEFSKTIHFAIPMLISTLLVTNTQGIFSFIR